MPHESFYFDPDASGLEVFLGPLEARVMELIWKRKELSVKKAMLLLGKSTDLAYTTVGTILARLTEKGLLVREKAGRNFIYRPTVDRETFLVDRLERIKACVERNFADRK